MSKDLYLKCGCMEDCNVILKFDFTNGILSLGRDGSTSDCGSIRLKSRSARQLAASLLNWTGYTHLSLELEHGMYSTVKDIVDSAKLFPDE